jgi:WD40 repeat protein
MWQNVRETSRTNVIVLEMVFLMQVSFGQDVLVQPYAQFVTENREDITSLAFSADGKLLAGDDDGMLQCWNLEGKRSIAKLSMKSGIVFTAFLSGDRSFVAVDKSGNVAVFDLLQGQNATTFRTKAKPNRATIDAGKNLLAVATRDDWIEIFDLKAMMPFGQIDARNKIDDLLFLGFDRLGQQLVGINGLANVVAWNPSTMKLIREVTLSGGNLHGSRSVIHSASTNRAANIFVVGLEEVALPRGGLSGMSNPRDLLRDNSAIAYDWNSGIEVKRVKTNSSIEQMVLGPGNDHIATIGDEGNNITFVDLRKGELGSTVSMSDRPKKLAISEDNIWMAAGAENGKVSVWKLQFRGDASVTRSDLPSLSGRIRTNSGTEPALKPGVPVHLAILNFEAKGMPQEIGDICLNSMSNSLANFEYITLIERKQIETVLKEQKFQASDLTDEKTSVQIGKLLSADHVLLCSIGKLGTSMILTARILDVETGKVVRGREVMCEECRDQDIYDAVKMLASTIAQ